MLIMVALHHATDPWLLAQLATGMLPQESIFTSLFVRGICGKVAFPFFGSSASIIWLWTRDKNCVASESSQRFWHLKAPSSVSKIKQVLRLIFLLQLIRELWSHKLS